MIDPSDKKLSIRKQAKLLGINRNRLAARPTKTSEEDLKIMAIMDDLHMECPFYGQRNFRENLKDHGYSIGRKRVRRLMRIMGIEALVPKPSTSVPAKGHKIFPYLLRNRDVSAVDEVWCADITYLPMEKGHAYLVAIMDCLRSTPAMRDPASSSGGRVEVGIGTAGPCLLGRSATRWTARSASARYGRHCAPRDANRRYSTRIRAANSLGRIGSKSFKSTTSKSAWMVGAAGWTTSSSSDFGAA